MRDHELMILQNAGFRERLTLDASRVVWRAVMNALVHVSTEMLRLSTDRAACLRDIAKGRAEAYLIAILAAKGKNFEVKERRSDFNLHPVRKEALARLKGETIELQARIYAKAAGVKYYCHVGKLAAKGYVLFNLISKGA